MDEICGYLDLVSSCHNITATSMMNCDIEPVIKAVLIKTEECLFVWCGRIKNPAEILPERTSLHCFESHKRAHDTSLITPKNDVIVSRLWHYWWADHLEPVKVYWCKMQPSPLSTAEGENGGGYFFLLTKLNKCDWDFHGLVVCCTTRKYVHQKYVIWWNNVQSVVWC